MYQYEEIVEPGTSRVPQKIRYNLELYWAAPTYNGEITLHHPLGATFIGLGLGAGVYFFEDDFETNYGLISVTSLTLGHRAFLSERIFTELSAEFLYPHNSIISNDVFKGGGAFGAFFGVGFYFPSLRRYLRNSI